MRTSTREETGCNTASSIQMAFGRRIRRKIQAEAGTLVPRSRTSLLAGSAGAARFYDNKGKPRQTYERFYGTHLYEDEPDLLESGNPIRHYDSTGPL